jgi:hypothetical protein
MGYKREENDSFLPQKTISTISKKAIKQDF